MERQDKVVLTLDSYEHGIMIRALNELRNDLLEEQRDPGPVEDVLLKGLIASSPVPIRAVDELPQGRGAVYDPEQNAILVKKGMDAPDIFRCVSLEAANVQLAKNHEGYSREAEGYKAYAVSYMLCQRYGVDVKGYDISRLDGVLQGQDPREEVPAALTDMRDTFKEMNGRMARAMGLTRASRQKEQER